MTHAGPERDRLRRRAFGLEYASAAWMTAEAVVAITAGIRARSIALAGFGLDSIIELGSAVTVIWQLRDQTAGQDRDRRAVRIIGVTFFALAAYLTAESIADLVTGSRPATSPAGLAITAAALLVMPALALAKRRTGQALGSRTLLADAAETAFCSLTAAAALLGTGLNAAAGWWQADPVAGLIIGGLAVREGIETWHNDERLG